MARMSPPGTEDPKKGKGLAVVIGVGPSRGGKMPPPGANDDQWHHPVGRPNSPPGGGKASEEEAGVIRSDSHCIDCGNYHADTGECDSVDGQFGAEDACVQFFTPAGGEGTEQKEETPGGSPAPVEAA